MAKQQNRISGAVNGSPQTASSRRNFMATAGAGTCLGGISLALIGALRSAIPAVLPEPSAQFKIGTAGDYRPGMAKHFAEENVVVFCDDEGVHAISTVCTHLGCIVKHDETGFFCPCHGSKYDSAGSVLQGPAPKALPWFQISQLHTGHLVVDRAQQIEAGQKFALSTEEA